MGKGPTLSKHEISIKEEGGGHSTLPNYLVLVVFLFRKVLVEADVWRKIFPNAASVEFAIIVYNITVNISI